MRPLGAYPPIGTPTVTIPITYFTPKRRGDPATENAENFDKIYASIGDWKGRYHDAMETKNWLVRGSSPVTSVAFDGFSYDPLRRFYFTGGSIGLSTSGLLYYSADGTVWKRAGTSTLPTTSGGSDDSNQYHNVCSDDGRYFTWRTTITGVLAVDYAFFNTTGGDNWSASGSQPTAQISHAYFAPSDNRFIACGLDNSTHVSKVWSVDIDSDTWDAMTLEAAAVESIPFGCGNQGNRLVATATRLWHTTSVASDFKIVPVPWTNLIGLTYLAGSFVFLAVTPTALYSSPNGVVWSKVLTGYEGLGTFTGPAAGLGDTCAVAFTFTTPDGTGARLLLIGRDSLRTWSDVNAPFTISAMLFARDHIVALETQKVATSMRINP